MKFYTYQNGDGIDRLAVGYDGQTMYPLANFGLSFTDMTNLICTITPDQLEMIASPSGNPIQIADTVRRAPIPHPAQDIVCLGVNYMEHRKESLRFHPQDFGTSIPKTVYFSKRVNEATTDGDSIPAYEGLVEQLDYEVELAVILGRDAKNVAPEDAKDYIFGYTVLNDVSARDLQTGHKQWYLGKSLDRFTPMGPCIVTKDEIAYPPVLHLTSTVNGERRQDSMTDLMLRDIDHIISELSEGMTLRAGTIIATGTPSGVGMGFTPPRFLKKGDTVVCTVEGIGSLTNRVE